MNEDSEKHTFDHNKYEDPSEALKWSGHSEEEEDNLKDCCNYVKSFVNQLEIRIEEPEWVELTVQPNTGCEAHDNMCIGLNPNTIHIYENFKEPIIVYDGEEYDLERGIQKLAERITRQNSSIEKAVEDKQFRCFYHLKVASAK